MKFIPQRVSAVKEFMSEWKNQLDIFQEGDKIVKGKIDKIKVKSWFPGRHTTYCYSFEVEDY